MEELNVENEVKGHGMCFTYVGMESSREGSVEGEGDQGGSEPSSNEGGEGDRRDHEPCSNGVSEENGETGEGGKEEGEKEEEVMEEEEGDGEKSDSGEQPLFHLTVVNSYGSQEVQKLESSKTYKFSSESVPLVII